jgi:hypothetical protein
MFCIEGEYKMQYFTSPELLTITGATIAFVGTIVLAFSLGGVFRELKFALSALSTTFESFISGGDIYVFNGLEKRIKIALKRVNIPIFIGLGLLVLSIFVQGISAYFSIVKSRSVTDTLNISQEISSENQKSINSLNTKIDSHIKLQTKVNDELARDQTRIYGSIDDTKHSLKKMQEIIDAIDTRLLKLEEVDDQKNINPSA